VVIFSKIFLILSDKLRIRILNLWEWLLLFIFLIFADPTFQSIQIGGVVSVVGVLLRVLASGYKADGKNPMLFGPYRYVRQPLLLGTFLVALGIALASRQALLAFILLPILAILYWQSAKQEEARLKHMWGLSYFQLAGSIPMFVPSLFPAQYPKLSSQPFSLRQSLVKDPNKEIYTFLLIGMAYGVFYGSMNTNFRLLYSSSVLALGVVAFIGRFLWVRRNELSSH
jgi:protein-S-isoprenylcysteine O-methyltransferase Ste14